MDKRNYDLFNIDELDLVNECINQPKMYLKHSDMLARAKKNLERAKVRIDVVEAELSRKIRSNPKKYCGEDQRDAAIKAEIAIRLAKHDVTENFIEAQYKVNLVSGAVTALDQRKRQLENIITLRGQGYNAEVRVRKEDREEIDKMKKERATRRSGGRKKK